MNLNTQENPIISAVIPAHNESQGITEAIKKIAGILSACESAWEIIIVDDGSNDQTYQKICQLSEAEPRIKGIALSRNFGKEAALTAGLDHCVGDAVVVIDADLQDPPELIPELLSHLNAGFDVVFARAVLHHTSNLEQACREVYRVLKPGGRFIAVREHVISKPDDLKYFFQIHPLHKLYGGENAFLLKKYKSALQRVGFVEHDVLSPLKSPINYFPHTQDSLREELVDRLKKTPFIQPLARALLAINPIFKICILMLSLVDSRPGRLYSFVSDKPSKSS